MARSPVEQELRFLVVAEEKAADLALQAGEDMARSPVEQELRFLIVAEEQALRKQVNTWRDHPLSRSSGSWSWPKRKPRPRWWQVGEVGARSPVEQELRFLVVAEEQAFLTSLRQAGEEKARSVRVGVILEDIPPLLTIADGAITRRADVLRFLIVAEEQALTSHLQAGEWMARPPVELGILRFLVVAEEQALTSHSQAGEWMARPPVELSVSYGSWSWPKSKLP